MADRFDELFGQSPDERWNSVFGVPDEEERKRREQWLKSPVRSADPGLEALTDPEQSRELGNIRRTAASVDKGRAERAEEERRQEEEKRRADEAYFLSQGPVGFAQMGEATKRREREAIEAGGDSFLETQEKFFENLGPKFQKTAGGLLQSIGEQGAAAVGAAASGVVGPAMGRIVESYLREPFREAAKPLAETGKAMSDEAQAALEANAPDFGPLAENHPYRYIYEIENALVDMGIAVGATAATRSPTVGSSTLGLQVFGQQYDDSRRMGRNPDEALQDATFMGVAETIGENTPLRLIMAPGGRFGKKILKAGFAEGVQELVTGTLQTGYDKGVLHPEMTWGEAIRQVVDSGIIGAVAGGGAAAVAHPFTRNNAPVDDLDAAIGDPFTDPRTASQAFSPGRDTITPAANAYAMERGAPQVTPEDVASPLPTDLIQEGKGAATIAVEEGQEDEILRQFAMPKVGSDVVVQRGPDGLPEIGKVLGSFDANGKPGIRVEMGDGSTYEQTFEDIQAGGQSIKPLDSYMAEQPAPVAVGETYFESNTPQGVPLKPSEAMPATGAARDVLKAKIKGVESGGKVRAKNPRSSASGLYQFTKGTWEALGGDWSQRFDPNLQEQMMDRLVDQNEAALQKGGFQPTAGNLYLAHFLGSGGALKALRDPNGRPSEDVVEANPFLAGWTNAQIAAWADKKMGGAGVVPHGTRFEIGFTDWLTNEAKDEYELDFPAPREAIQLEEPEQSYTEKANQLAKAAATDGVELKIEAGPSPNMAEGDSPHVWLEWIESKEAGKGRGTEAMKKLTAEADKLGVPVALNVDDTLADTSRLRGFYERFGFKADPVGGTEMVREPQGESRTEAEPTAQFDSDTFNRERDERITASKAAGNKHLDDLEPAVETMRGKQVYYAHDPNIRGTVRTVANTGEVVIHWKDAYSAEKEMATEKQDGGKTVMESWLQPTDLKDYVVGTPKQNELKAAMAAKVEAPAEPEVMTMPDGKERKLAARPELGPTFADPGSPDGVLRTIQEGRHSWKDQLTGPVNWALRNGYATPLKKGKLELTEKGVAELKRLGDESGNSEAARLRDIAYGEADKLGLTGMERIDYGMKRIAELRAESGQAAPAQAIPTPKAKFDRHAHLQAMRDLVKKSNVKLDAKSVGKKLGLTPMQARSVIGLLASTPNSGVIMTKRGKLRRIARRIKPLHAMEWIRDRGGVKSGKHDLRNLGALARYPGVINNKRGLEVDELGEALWEAGYIRTVERPTEAEVLDFLADASVNRRYATDDLGDIAEVEEREENDLFVERYTDEINDIADEYGLTIDQQTMEAAFEYIAAGESTEYAVEAAIHDEAARDLAQLADETGDEAYAEPIGELYEGEIAEQRDSSAEERFAGPESVEGDAGQGGALDAEPESARPPEVDRPPARVHDRADFTDEQADTLPNPRKDWRGVPDADVETAKDANGGFAFRYSYSYGNGGQASPFSHNTGYATREEARAAGFAKLRERLPTGEGQLYTESDRKTLARIRDWLDQIDALGPQKGELRAGLQAKTEAPMRGKKAQKAPGEDGGLFDTRDTTGDLFDQGKAEQGAIGGGGKPLTEAGMERYRQQGRQDSADGLENRYKSFATDTQAIRAYNEGYREPTTLTPEGRAAQEYVAATETYSREGEARAAFVAGASGFKAAFTPVQGVEQSAYEAGQRWAQEQGATKTVTPKATKEPDRLIAVGEILLSKSGRRLSPFPIKGGSQSDRQIVNEHKRIARWLIDENRKEYEGDDWTNTILNGIERGFPKNLSQSDWDNLNLLLFGDELGPNDSNRTGEITGKAKKAATKQPSDYGAKNKLVTKTEADAIRERMRNKLRNQLNSGIDPEMLADGARLAVFHIEAGARKFGDFAKAIAEDLGVSVTDLRQYLRSWYNGARDLMEDMGAPVADMDGPEQVRQALNELQEAGDVPSSRTGLESDREGAQAGDAAGEAAVSPGRREAGSGGREGVGQAAEGGRPERDGQSQLFEAGPAAPRAPSDRSLFDGPSAAPSSAADAGGRGGSPDVRGTGLGDERTRPEAVTNAAGKDASLAEKRRAQAAANKLLVRPRVRENVEESLPFLKPEQREDVWKAEESYAKRDGFMLTNGTGTGKTFSGGGVVARFYRQGKRDILIVAPSQDILKDWKAALAELGVEANILESTTEAGKGVVLTTYANMGSNPSLSDRKWDLAVADESHKLMSSKNADITANLTGFRALTNHPQGRFDRAKNRLRKKWAKVEAEEARFRAGARPHQELPPELQEKKDALWKETQALADSFKGEPRSKALFLSATPFAYVKAVEYGEGYLFDFDKEQSEAGKGRIGGYNKPDARQEFFIRNFGYRMRTGKLTEPDAGVNTEVMEREFHERLKREGALSARALEVDRDYDRKFVLVADGVGAQIDTALEFLASAEEGKYRPLWDIVRKRFDYLSRMRLLEAINAHHAIPIIREHLKLGRKIVVFHQYNDGGGFNPFLIGAEIEGATVVRYDQKTGQSESIDVKPLYDEFIRKNPFVEKMDFGKMRAPIVTLTQAFPDAFLYNGRVPQKQRTEAKRLFNQDGSGKDLIIVQADAGEAGISLHDTTGKHQRVTLNLGMPVRPMTAIQQEGRTYRVGQESDAIFRYLTTGTAWERAAFAQKVAERASTAENLGMGDAARALRQSFIDAYADAADNPPSEGEGKGGKEVDRANNKLSPFERAKTYYWAQAKNTKSRDYREGVDYYATPEPVGFKMAEWANLKTGEKALEPSAGHGAIARFLREDTDRTVIEPSTELASRAALASPGARMLVERFEDLHAVNKYDGIVMNPPYGVGGKTAIEHVAKAAGHLRNGGRLVALIPDGGQTDARFDKWMESEEARHVYMVGEVKLPESTFERAGTKIRTRIVILERQKDKASVEKMPQSKRVDLSNAKDTKELFDRIEDIGFADRIEPETKESTLELGAAGEVMVAGIRFKVSGGGDSRYIAKPGFIPKSTFARAARLARTAGGEYVTGSGFTFPEEEQRKAFLEALERGDDDQPVVMQDGQETPVGVRIETAETIHAKKGIPLYVAQLGDRVETDVFAQLRAVAKQHNGYWSSYRGAGAIPGFQFESEEDRAAFIAKVQGPLGSVMEQGAGYQSADPFYSALERAVERSTNTRAPAAQWAATLRKTPGVKQEELEWSGLLDFLEMQEGQVAKDDLLKLVREGGIQVDERVLGEDPDPDDIEAMYDSRIRELVYNRVENAIEFGGGPATHFAEETEDGQWQVFGERASESDIFPTEEQANRVAHRMDVEARQDFEIDVHNEIESSLLNSIRAEIERDFAELNESQFKSWSSDPSNPSYRELLITLPPGQAGNPDRAPSTHWDWEGVVAHARFMEKLDAEGKRVLFIEEVQSDWHQKGRDEGYEPTGAELQARIDERREELERAKERAQAANVALIETAPEVLEKWREVASGLPSGWDDATLSDTGRQRRQVYESLMRRINIGEQGGALTTDGQATLANEIRRFIMNIAFDPLMQDEISEYDAAQLALNEAGQAYRNANKGGIPNAPFKSTWPALVMKRMVRWAVDNGFDKVAWTTGEEQAERYNLASHISQIRSYRGDAGPDRVTVVFIARSGGTRSIVDGLVDQGHGESRDGYWLASRADLEAALGKDLGGRVFEGGRAATSSRYENQSVIDSDGLTIGGEGMKAFYDRNLVNITNDLIKKYGAKVERVGVASPSVAGVQETIRVLETEIASMKARLDLEERGLKEAPSLRQAERTREIIERLQAAISDREISLRHNRTRLAEIEGGEPHPGFILTDKLKEAAAGGFALFQPRGRAYVAANGEAQGTAGEPLRRDSAALPVRRGGSVRALGITSDLRREGSTALVGRTVEHPKELAELAQVYRDPRYETFRVFFVKTSKQGAGDVQRGTDTIIHATGVSARLPGEAPLLPKGLGATHFAAWLKGEMERTGADGYYLLHNHPSGDPNASSADKAITTRIARDVPGFIAHVVINSGKYGVINEYGGDKVRDLTGLGPDKLFVPAKPHAMLGVEIGHFEQLAKAAKSLQQEGFVTLVGVDSKNGVRVIADYPESELDRSPLVLAAALRRLQRMSGAASVFMVGRNLEHESVRKAFHRGLLTEAVDTSGTTRQFLSAREGTNSGRLNRPKGFGLETGRFVAEEKHEYDNPLNYKPAEEVQPYPPRLWKPVRDIVDSLGGSSQKIGEAVDRWRMILQDRMIPVLRRQTIIERQLGRKLTEQENPYLGEELLTGRTGARLEELTEKHVEPLFQAMRDEKVTADELETYLYARHAKERNARISAINPEFDEGTGSGMTDDEADAILQAVKDSGKQEALDRLAARVDAMLDLALKTRVESGLLSQEEADNWRRSYKHYVPLRGRPGDELEDVGADRINRASGITVKGKESRRAFGRKSRAADILPFVLLQSEEAIVRAELNRVAQQFLELAKAAPDKKFWTVDKIRRVPVVNKKTGLVSYRLESKLSAEDAPYTVVAKVEGVEHRITMNRDNRRARLMADAMRNLSAQNWDFVVRTFGAVNRFLSAINTSYNPEFVISNAFRDMQTAAINLNDAELAKLVRRVAKDYPAALKAATKGSFGNESGEWGKWFAEFKQAGGRTYWNNVDDLDRLRKRVEDSFRTAGTRLGAKQMLKRVGHMIEGVNNGVENAVRLSAYKNARELGLSQDRAASIAKNVTVNFNRRGMAGPLINSLYLFFNASIQGSVRILQAMHRSKKVRAIVATTVVAGFWLDFLNRLLSDEDDDGEKFYDKIPEFVKARNLVIMGEGGRYYKIMLPWGYNAFPNLGRAMSRVIHGDSALDATADWFWSAVEAFNPVGGTNSIINLVAPTIIDPIADMVRNRDFAERPIMPDEKQFGPQQPDAQRYWGSVPPYWKAVTDFLTDISGGDSVRPGGIDVSPETLDYIQQTVLGGAGNFVRNVMSLTGKLLSDDPADVIDKNDLPFVRRVVGDKPVWYDKAAFYERLGQIEQVVSYGKDYAKSGNVEGLEQLFIDKADVIELEPVAKLARKDMTKWRKLGRQIEEEQAKGNITADEAREMRANLKAKEEQTITDFNAIYLSVIEKPVRP